MTLKPKQAPSNMPEQVPHRDDDATAVQPSTIPVQGEGAVKILYEAKDFKEVYLDEYTREPLPHELVCQAIREELEYFNSSVWELADVKAVMADKRTKNIEDKGAELPESSN